MMKRCFRLFLVFGMGLLSFSSYAQDAFIPYNRDLYHNFDRLDIINPPDYSFYSSQKPYRRQITAKYTLNNPYGPKHDGPVAPHIRLHTLPIVRELVQDNWEYCDSLPGIFGTWADSSDRQGFYKTEEAFYGVNSREFYLSAGPVIGFGKSWDANSDDNLFQNTRGIQIRGGIGNKVGFYTFVSENQFRFPAFYRSQIDSAGVIPGVGFYKRFKETGHDFFTARGYITFSPIKEINVQFGQDQNFIGDGYRSLIWSDNAKENLFLKLQTEVWKIKYMNLFSELTNAEDVIGNGQGLSRKYSAFHHLTVALRPNLHIGVFEQVIFDRSDSNTTNGYDINYLNPLIFYRAVEHGLNSSDNVIMGINWKWNVLRRFSIYGQYVLDEFKKDEMFNRTGWWGNKWGFQGGIKYINAFSLPGLDLQYEYNTVRPYMYTHFKSSQNFTNYNQSMAHPLGANFKEHAIIARARAGMRLRVVAKVFISNQGLDSATNSFYTYGADLTKDYLSRPQETGIAIGDGVSNELISTELRLTYMFFHNLNLDLIYFSRNQKNALSGEQKDAFYTLSLRYNLPYKSYN